MGELSASSLPTDFAFLKAPRSIMLAFGVLFTASEAGAQTMSLNLAKNLPISVRGAIEVASRTGNDKPASLNMVCGSKGDRYLVLVTRLPFPRSLERNIRPGSRETASLFIDGINQEVRIAFELTDIGRMTATVGNYLGFTEDGEPDTAFSVPLSSSQIDTLQSWFGTEPPNKVSVVGLVETGVYMHGLVTAKAIRELAASCAS